ncbi:MAG: GNAT family N-acetyltransferase [Hyphomicrobiaceae bacterium]|nr:GNAT family N-acetyltransferase [Hyphomicrobiaceae bacterium]MCC0025335.1 GNAT family N-acetyltransferase [Hyphomicrobiaceae bacterium]
MDETEIHVTATPSPEDLAMVGENLAAFNDTDVGAANRVPIAVLAKDESGEVVAGISGYTAWGWLYLQWLWVADSQRGKGLARKMLDAAEGEARKRGCHAAYIDTFNPVALRTYQRAGYEPFGELKDFPVGRTRTFLQKRF